MGFFIRWLCFGFSLSALRGRCLAIVCRRVGMGSCWNCVGDGTGLLVNSGRDGTRGIVGGLLAAPPLPLPLSDKTAGGSKRLAPTVATVEAFQIRATARPTSRRSYRGTDVQRASVKKPNGRFGLGWRFLELHGDFSCLF